MHELDLKTNSTQSRYKQSILPSPLQLNILLDSYYKHLTKVTHIKKPTREPAASTRAPHRERQ